MDKNNWSIQNWTIKDLNALVEKLGGNEIARMILQGEMEVDLRMLFDKNGRRIPRGFREDDICDPNPDLRLKRPKLFTEDDYAGRIMRLHKHLDAGIEVTLEHFMSETKRLLAIIESKPHINNITNSVYMPVVLPKLVTDDLGSEMELYLAGVEKSFKEIFSNWEFHKQQSVDALTSKVNIVAGSRYEQLISRLKQGPAVGIYFPSSLHGFSINASREQMRTLPKGFILSGMDVLIAMIMYPDILIREKKMLGLNMAALNEGFVNSFFFRSKFIGDILVFGRAQVIEEARADYSSGLLFIG